MRQDSAASLIGIAMKAGKVASGETAAENAIRKGSAHLVILSEDASHNTRKKFSNMGESRGIQVVTYLSKADLGRSVGRGERSCLAVTDGGLAEKIAALIIDNQQTCTGKVVENIGEHQNS